MRNPIFRFSPIALYQMQETFAMAALCDGGPEAISQELQQVAT